MLTLGIETSGGPGTAALCRDDACLIQRELSSSGRRHAQALVAEIDRMFRETGLLPSDCDVVAVSIGPGSFTGLRVGAACAKTFAYATGCRLAAVDTFLAIAENSPAGVTELYVAADAQRGDLYVGHFARRPGGVWEPRGSIRIVETAAWAANRHGENVLSGPAAELVEAVGGRTFRVLPPEYRQPLARGVAQIGARQVAAGQVHDLWSLEPRYIRRSAAEEKLKQDSEPGR